MTSIYSGTLAPRSLSSVATISLPANYRNVTFNYQMSADPNGLQGFTGVGLMVTYSTDNGSTYTTTPYPVIAPCVGASIQNAMPMILENIQVDHIKVWLQNDDQTVPATISLSYSVVATGEDVAETGFSVLLTSATGVGPTNVKATPGTVLRIVNAGAAMTQTISLYDENTAAGSAADLIYGPQSLGSGQVVDVDVALSKGLTYQLSGALSSNLEIEYQ